MQLSPGTLRQYHVFLSSPGDVAEERRVVRSYFEKVNRHIGELWSIRFEVVDWENYASIGIGAPQTLITEQTLNRYRDSLVLVVGVMAQRFGSPTANAESGTEDEFRWALKSFHDNGFPEIKWFFKDVEQFVAPPDPALIATALEQWQKVRTFKDEVKNEPIFIGKYRDLADFRDVFENDVGRWLHNPQRPWITEAPDREDNKFTISIPDAYLEAVERNFHRLDIAGIDNDRAFEIPLSEIYVRLQVLFDDETEEDSSKINESGPIDIQTALLRYNKLVIVGDPGSGKSTFLKYVALMLARAIRGNNVTLALEKLSLPEPLPLPIFASCWDISDFLQTRSNLDVGCIVDFLTQRLTANGFALVDQQLEEALSRGSCFLLFDGLDEVPSDRARAVISRLLEEFVKKFDKNRYLITSRVRAYTGETILKGAFARADIQPFNASDRLQFLTNWIALLFETKPADVATLGTEANREFQSVTSGIEKSDRIRPLAVNPLLLTVIAIVHWNRKRLPEQRIDLYDECVDVLLGQRKAAERVLLTRKIGSRDQDKEQTQLEERAWIRKRFGEIALYILGESSDPGETSKNELVRLLAPRFVDQGAVKEVAEIRAAQFLSRQEVSSGLLVSRREHNYRFVHLAFQEYLAAWYIANQDFDEAISVIEPHIRQQRWFETLQLLGSEWAKQSDEKLDRYIEWLLRRQGNLMTDRAPVIALCANILKDVVGIAQLQPGTRRDFQRAVETTLDAFRPSSGIPALTQLGILEALGQIGAAVKPQLIAATKSGLFQVRRRAIEMLLPHLSDDDLFAMTHLLDDRSKEPIKTYLLSLLSRDVNRTVDVLCECDHFGGKATDAFTETVADLRQALAGDVFTRLVRHVFEKGSSHSFWYGSHYPWPSRARLLMLLKDDALLQKAVRNDRESGVRVRALRALVDRKGTDTWELLKDRALNDASYRVQYHAFELIADRYGASGEAWPLILETSSSAPYFALRMQLLRLLADRRKTEPETILHLKKAARVDPEPVVRREAFELIAESSGDDPETWRFIYAAFFEEKTASARKLVLEMLWERLRNNPQIRTLLGIAAKSDEDASIRQWAMWTIVRESFKDKAVVRLLSENLDGREPALDIQDPVEEARIVEASVALNDSESEIRDEYRRIAALLEKEWGVEFKVI